MKKFYIQKSFPILWSELSIQRLYVQTVWLFLYAQRGFTISYDVIQLMLRLPEKKIKKAVAVIDKFTKGELQWQD